MMKGDKWTGGNRQRRCPARLQDISGEPRYRRITPPPTMLSRNRAWTGHRRIVREPTTLEVIKVSPHAPSPNGDGPEYRGRGRSLVSSNALQRSRNSPSALLSAPQGNLWGMAKDIAMRAKPFPWMVREEDCIDIQRPHLLSEYDSLLG